MTLVCPRRRTAARVHRAGPEISHLVLPGWMNGQITMPVPTADLTSATGLDCDDLPGTHFAATPSRPSAYAELPYWPSSVSVS